MAGQFWEVVGGAEKGIIVRTGRDLKSAEHPSGRLAKGSIVVQLALVGERLRYTLLDGEGPLDGWVSLKLKDAKLVAPLDRSSDTQSAASSSSPAKGKTIWLMPQGSRGDVQPVVAMGIGLQQHGYAVRVLAGPEHKGFVASFGLQYTEQGPNGRDELQKRAEQVASQGKEALKGNMEQLTGNLIKEVWFDKNVLAASAEVIVNALKTEVPDLVITTHMNYAASLLPWKLHRVPTMEVDLCNLSQLTESDEYTRTEKYAEMKESAEYVEAAVGINPLADIDADGYQRYRRQQCYSAFSKLLLPGGISSEIQALCLGFFIIRPSLLVKDMTQFGGADTLLRIQDFLDADAARPPVYVGWGSMLLPPETLLKFIAAFKEQKLRAIICKGWGDLSLSSFTKIVQKFFPQDQMGLAAYAKDEKSILFVENCPHEWIFPRCLCTIHHGGAGTTCAALRSGVPTIITPVAADQFRNANTIETMGVGCQYDLMAPTLIDPALTKALLAATKDAAMRAKAQEVGSKIRSEDPIASIIKVVDAQFVATASSEGSLGFP